MKQSLFVLMCVVLLGAGCSSVPRVETIYDTDESDADQVDYFADDERPTVFLPLEGYHPVFKRFGEYVEDRFTGYHAGEDLEVLPEDLVAKGPVGDAEYVEIIDGIRYVKDLGVVAIADGTVIYKDSVPGYGGVIIIDHEIDGESVKALYGHVDIASTRLEPGIEVRSGTWVADLGADQSEETDGERRHLHFALYKGDGIQLQGYESTPEGLNNWINPSDFFVSHGLSIQPDCRNYHCLWDRQGHVIFDFDFEIPKGWDVEYIPSIEALNLYEVSGSGTARDRSQILIRYFDASSFLTLSTVTIHSTEDLTIGAGDYVARRYDIEKKAEVADFKDQPTWRNDRHIVTDFRTTDGFTRYYVVASNPELDPSIYKAVLSSIFVQ